MILVSLHISRFCYFREDNYKFLGCFLQIESGETDAWLSLGLMFHLSVLPLTRQLTNISGNLWSKTLQVWAFAKYIIDIALEIIQCG